MAKEALKGIATQVGVIHDAGSLTAYQVDSAFVFGEDGNYTGNSGDAVVLRFSAIEAQTNAAFILYAYCTAVGGTGGSFTCVIREGASSPGADSDRPDYTVSAIATSSADTPVANTWATFSFASVSLTAGKVYFAMIINVDADPATNYASFAYRGVADTLGIIPLHFNAGYTADGFATDPSLTGTYIAPMVVKYGSGAIIGMPYVGTEAHASNTNWRGTRFTFNFPLRNVIGCIIWNSGINWVTSIYAGASQIATHTAMAIAQRPTYAGFASVDLVRNTAYDFVVQPSTSSTFGNIYTMGEAEGDVPADVLASRPYSCAYVEGSTPGSFTADTSKIIVPCAIIISDFLDPDFPAASSVLTSDTVDGSAGTFDEAARNTDPGEVHVEYGVTYKIQNVTKEGSLVAGGGGGGGMQILGGSIVR